MEVVKTIRPGAHGSHRFLDEWGDKLVAVRYRKAGGQNRIYTTIEVIVDERQTAASPNVRILQMTGRNSAVALRVHFDEQALRQKIKHAGGKWSRQLKLWLLAYNDAVKMGIRDRIVEGAAEKCTDVDMEIQG